MRRLLSVALACAAVIVPAPARADPPGLVTAVYDDRYAPPTVIVVQGQELLFIEADPAPHDLQSFDTDEYGDPLFWTGRPIHFGQQAWVTGVERLEPGPYLFFCNLHDAMWGELVVEPRAPTR